MYSQISILHNQPEGRFSSCYYLHVFKICDSKSWQMDTIHVNKLFASDEVFCETCLQKKWKIRTSECPGWQADTYHPCGPTEYCGNPIDSIHLPTSSELHCRNPMLSLLVAMETNTYRFKCQGCPSKQGGSNTTIYPTFKMLQKVLCKCETNSIQHFSRVRAQTCDDSITITSPRVITQGGW